MTTYPIDPNNDITFGRFFDETDAYLRAHPDVVTDSYRRGILPSLIRAAEEATGKRGDELRTCHANNYIPDLHAYAKRAGGTSAVENASRVRRGVKVMTGYSGPHSPSMASCAKIPPSARELLEHCPGEDAAQVMALFFRVVVFAGINMPEIDALDPILNAADTLGISRRLITQYGSYYRTARAARISADPTAAERFGALREQVTLFAGYGFKTLPDIDERLRAAGYNGAAADLDDYAMFAWLFPTLHGQCEAFAAEGRAAWGAPFARGSIENTRGSMRQLSALLLWHAPNLYRSDIEAIEFIRIQMPSVERIKVVSRACRTKAQIEADEGENTCTLLQYLIDRESPAMIERSKLRKRIEAARMLYTPAGLALSVNFWVLILEQYGRDWAKKSPARWAAIEGPYRSWDKFLHQYMLKNGKAALKDKRRAIETVTLPMVVCVFLPMLAMECDEAEKAWAEARALAEKTGHANPDSHREVRRRAVTRNDLLFDYNLLGTVFDDGKRDAQYRFGRAGVDANFRPDFEDGRLVAVLTKFGRGSEREALKDHENKNDKPDPVVRSFSGMLRMDLVERYLRGPRAEALFRRGLATRETYSFEEEVQSGKFTWFVSKGNRASDPTGAHGENFSNAFGRVLHRCCRKYLGRDLPDFDALDTEKWFGIFSIHISRLLTSAYWGGVRGFWKFACDLTDDMEDTLRKDYSVVRPAVVLQMRGERTWEHPNVYDAWLDRLVGVEANGATCTAESFNPLDEIPESLLPPATVKILRAKRRPKTKRQLRSAAPRIRHAKPVLSNDFRNRMRGEAA